MDDDNDEGETSVRVDANVVAVGAGNHDGGDKTAAGDLICTD